MLTVRQMRYFDALATTRHFGRAAEMVNVSQPALSAQIAELERDLGILLFERNRSGAILTGQGEALLPEIRAILNAVDALYDRAQQSADVLEGRLRLGIIPTVAPYLVPVLIPLLKARFPRLEVELRELLTAGCVDDVRAGRLDCAVVALPQGGDALETLPLFKDRFLIAMADDESTVLVSPMTEAQMDVDRLLLLEEGHCLRDQALSVCGTSAGRRVANYGATSMATLLQMVSHGMGITLIPEIAVREERGRNRMRIVPFAEPQPSREIGLIYRERSRRSADHRALADVIRDAAAVLLG
jgi:LysR family hydrogen peroxide-inducible transcriptional activator